MIRPLLTLGALLLASATAGLAQSSNSGSAPATAPQQDSAKTSSPPEKAATQNTGQTPPANPPQTNATKKPKKIWTENEIGNLKSPVSVVGGASSAAGNGNSTSGSGPRNAESYRQRLAPLREQLDDVEQQIQEVKKYGAQAGRYNNMSLDALEAKKSSLQKKIDAVEEEARKNGVEPGQLR